ncbi:MAG: hypothetical protein JSS66_03310 [Armatimonadetes bacterium]|nr:hypothetical protein [Armatimonadota bacterium]
MRPGLLSISALFASTSCVPSDPWSASTPPAKKDYVHAGSGFSFPAKVAGFARSEVKVYDKVGDDVSVGYDVRSSRIALTFYVYPKLKNQPSYTLKDHYEFCRSEVFRNHDGTKEEGHWSGGEVIGGKKRPVFRAMFSFDSPSRSNSELFLTEHGDWYVLVRSSYPESNARISTREVSNFFASFPWPD